MATDVAGSSAVGGFSGGKGQVVGRKGNGTGPGTPFPLRRGPTKGPRKPKGHPAHLRSIEVHIGGRWTRVNGGEEVVYEGGMVRYIHNVDPDNFQLPELFMFTQMVLIPNVLLPARMWFHSYDVELPGGLVPITSEDKLDDMWANANQYNRWIARVYMQDCEIIRKPGELKIGKEAFSYWLPRVIPVIDKPFRALDIHYIGQEMHKDFTNQGEKEIRRQELYGERWYIDEEVKPKIPLDRSVPFDPENSKGFMMEVPTMWWGKYHILKGSPPKGTGKPAVFVPKEFD